MNNNISYRNKGKEALGLLLKSKKNIEIIEKYIYEVSLVHSSKEFNFLTSEKSTEKVYKMYIYQTLGEILNKKKLEIILSNIKKHNLGWYHLFFKNLSNKLDEQDNFIENPFEVEESIQQCTAINKKTGKICNSKRVLYYQKQERGADEPMTTYNTCCECGAKWKYNG